jgi:hypothetical protein
VNRRALVPYAVGLVLATVFVWWPGALAVLGAIVARELFQVRFRRLQLAGAVLMAVVPVVWLSSNWSRLGSLSPQLVTLAPWPGRLAGAALTLVAFGLLLELVGIDDKEGPATR